MLLNLRSKKVVGLHEIVDIRMCVKRLTDGLPITWFFDPFPAEFDYQGFIFQVQGSSFEF